MKTPPANRAELAALLREAEARREKVLLPELSLLCAVRQYTPEDLTVRVECGLTLESLQNLLARHGQWLPLDPPAPATLTLRELISTNASGPRRFGHGSVREHLIGLEVLLADGRLVHSGGNVVKNVAGYDLLKLFVGAHDSLGLPVEATFKLSPRPEAELFFTASPGTLAEAARLTAAVLASPLTPSILDWHRGVTTSSEEVQVVVGFGGTKEDVAWQTVQAARLGLTTATTLAYETEFWTRHRGARRRISVRPSQLAQAVDALGTEAFVARAGNGVVYAPGPALPPPEDVVELSRRLKTTFDPHHILPELPS